MKGKKIHEFIRDLYYNPEVELYFQNTRYSISGFIDDNNTSYTLEMWSVDNDLLIFTYTDKYREHCVERFEEAKIFNGKTIYEVEDEIEVLYG